MTRYLYMVAGLRADRSTYITTEELCRLGLDGWELVAVDASQMYLRRPLVSTLSWWRRWLA